MASDYSINLIGGAILRRVMCGDAHASREEIIMATGNPRLIGTNHYELSVIIHRMARHTRQSLRFNRRTGRIE